MEQPPHEELHPRAYWGLKRYFGWQEMERLSRDEVRRRLARTPNIEQQLLSLNGIGEKIAGEIMNWVWNEKPVSMLHIQTRRRRWKWRMFGRKWELIITKK